jgi:hypothetical protein
VRKIETDAGRRTRQIEIDEQALDRAAARTRIADFSVNDLAEVIADTLKAERREILEHVGRLLTLVEFKMRDEKARAGRLHQRLTELESGLRRDRKYCGRIA